MHRILKSIGSLYLHGEPTASHYLKIILDEGFGKRHDTIFRYSKTKDYVFNLAEVCAEYAEATKKDLRITLETKEKDLISERKN